MNAGTDSPFFDADGHLRSALYGDGFHSRDGGLAEAGHVFLAGNGLPGRFRNQRDFVIGELGFGTGLNFIVTWRAWARSRPDDGMLHFVSFEKHPLEGRMIERALARWPEIAAEAEVVAGFLDRLADGRRSVMADAHTRLTVVDGDCRETLPQFALMADAWYLDGFSPGLNEAMWSLGTMQAVAAHTRPGGTFATYTAAGWVRRNLEAAGFQVERRKGFGRKRHMSAGHLESAQAGIASAR